MYLRSRQITNGMWNDYRLMRVWTANGARVSTVHSLKLESNQTNIRQNQLANSNLVVFLSTPNISTPLTQRSCLTTDNDSRDLRSFVIRFDFESYVRFEMRFVSMVRFEIFESSALSIFIRKETIGGG